jgi:glycosyltransferase involved in cell wall biosynthesis
MSESQRCLAGSQGVVAVPQSRPPEATGVATLGSRRILIFGFNYAPELTGIAPYTTALAEHYAQLGHRVRVITGVPHYPAWRPLPIPPSTPGSNPALTRCRHFIPKRPTVAGRMLFEATWFATASRALPGAACDVVVGIIPNLAAGVLAWLAGRRAGAPVGLVLKDLVGPAAAQSGYQGGRSVAGVTGAIERFVLRRAHRVAVISEGFLPYLQRAGVPPARIGRVRDWSHPVAPSESVVRCRARLQWADEDFICLHAGNMGQKQELDNLLDAAALIQDPHVKVVLAGDGNDRRRLEARVARQGIPNVSFVGLQASGRYEAMLAAADLLVLNQRASVGDMSLPCKLASYFSAGRPVVAAAAFESPAAREVRTAQAGMVVAPGQPAALAEALVRIKAAPEMAAAMGARGQSYARRHLSQESALAAYDDFLSQLLEIGRQ